MIKTACNDKEIALLSPGNSQNTRAAVTAPKTARIRASVNARFLRCRSCAFSKKRSRFARGMFSHNKKKFFQTKALRHCPWQQNRCFPQKASPALSGNAGI